MSPTSRSTFQIQTAQGITDMFQEREYKSQYFFGEQGAENWEDFVAGSREAHDEALAKSGRLPQRRDFLDDDEDLDPLIDLSVLDDDESEDTGEVFSGGVRLNILDEDEEDADDAAVRLNILDENEAADSRDEEDTTLLKGAASLHALDVQGADALAGLDFLGGGAAAGLIASALDRVAEALERGGTIPTPPPSSASNEQAVAAFAATAAPVAASAMETGAGNTAVSAEMEARLREMEERLLRMQDMQEEKDEMIRILREQNAQLRSAPPESAETEEPPAYEPVPEGEAELPEPTIEFAFEDELTDETKWSTDEESGAFEDEGEEDTDFMSALASYAASLESMTVFERMRNDGETVLRITVDDLARAIKAKREQGTYF